MKTKVDGRKRVEKRQAQPQKESGMTCWKNSAGTPLQKGTVRTTEGDCPKQHSLRGKVGKGKVNSWAGQQPGTNLHQLTHRVYQGKKQSTQSKRAREKKIPQPS